MSSDDGGSDERGLSNGGSESAVARRSGHYELADGEIVSDEQDLALDALEGAPSAVIARQRGVSMKMSSHRGPLPAPTQFREYESICPGAADRIIRMAEEEGSHRRGLENRTLDAAIGTERRTQYLSTSVFIVALLSGAGLLALGLSIAGYTALVTSLVSLVGGGIWNKVEDAKMRKLQERQVLAIEARAQQQKAAAKKPANSKKPNLHPKRGQRRN